MSRKRLWKSAITLTAATLAGIAAVNKLLHMASGRLHLLEQQSGEYYDWRFGKIFYQKMGTGEPLVLIHTLDPAVSSREWSRMEKELSKEHTLYLIDLPGCGKSDKPKLTYTNYLYVQMLTDFMNDIVKEPADIAVSGLSASFVIMACSIDSSLFKKIFIFNPVPLQEGQKIPTAGLKCMKKLIECPIIGTLLYHILYSKGYMEKRLIEKYMYFGYLDEEMLNVFYESAHSQEECGKYLFASMKANYLNINFAAALKNIDNSVVLFLGENCSEGDKIKESYLMCNRAIDTVTVHHTKNHIQMEQPKACLEQMKIYMD